MLFTSIIFLCFFLPVVILCYFFIPQRFKNLYLLVASLCFYIWGEKEYVILLLSTICVNYGCSLLIEKGHRRIGLWTAVILSLGSLFYFKYATFAYTNIINLFNWLGINESYHSIPQIVLPLGISFFTFQVLSYTIDVYRGNIHASRSLLNFATYITLFPHLIAGPIVRYIHIEKQLTKKELSLEQTAKGIERFILGLIKKMFIANNCAIIADTIFPLDPAFYSAGAAWIAAIAYSLQIFFDFSAYSDMAIGLAWIFGFKFHENFNYPYISNSIKEFWRRWHISLSTWFRDYLYIPLGGSRGSSFRTYINLSIVFFATGLWHGASWNFIFWGAWHGFFIVIERIGFDSILQKLWKPLQHIYLLLIVIIGWVFFRADDFQSAISLLKKMFFIDNDMTDVVYYASSFVTIKNVTIIIPAMLFCLPIFLPLKNKFISLVKKDIGIIIYYLLLILLLMCVITMISVGTYNPFIYFRF
ncbi:MBOAT family protein [Dysgonomonas sp. 216]|uniref:MBOAT family O-acyltransferase n=1 Tax=Dysgonomonas sp. 216 TaxID=2302934 RepID=UPI0013D5353B|nr:MBOAT family protein [Dysgonomonas sp. 216]NDW17718.1 MBOAT family protein [Dysgonomonas sp. 216]